MLTHYAYITPCNLKQAENYRDAVNIIHLNSLGDVWNLEIIGLFPFQD